MKRNIYILFTIGLFIRFSSHSVNLNTERLSNLKRLIENNIAYDSIAPIDSVIAWGQQLSPIIEKENKMELSFSIRQLVVYIYPARETSGKQSTARQMYEKAETMRYDLEQPFERSYRRCLFLLPICPKKPSILIRKPSVIPPRLQRTTIIKK